MKKKNLIIPLFAVLFLTNSYAQILSSNGKTVKVEELPEYIIVNCDNVTSILSSSIRIAIQAKNSKFGVPLQKLEDLLENKSYLKISNQTDLLNTMSSLGFEYVNAFPQNTVPESSFSRSGFVFRKKEKYRN